MLMQKPVVYSAPDNKYSPKMQDKPKKCALCGEEKHRTMFDYVRGKNDRRKKICIQCEEKAQRNFDSGVKRRAKCK